MLSGYFIRCPSRRSSWELRLALWSPSAVAALDTAGSLGASINREYSIQPMIVCASNISAGVRSLVVRRVELPRM